MIGAILLAATTAAMHLRSGDFIAGGAIPLALMARDCGGANRSPALLWTNAPKGVKSFALILHDPDAPLAGGYDHWVLYDVPAATTQIRGDATPAKAKLGLASTGHAVYVGPCPPPGPAHHYVFTLYALDVATLPGPTPLGADALERAIRGHVLAKATLEATASHP